MADFNAQILNAVGTDELVDMNAEFDGEIMLALLKDGEILKRKSEKYAIRLEKRETYDGEESEVAQLNEQGKVIAYTPLTTEQLLANDWQVIRI